jgi:23S rRNA (cytidine1920-2'-O)/16S rRNA (cytidine1409-2'-O)-methyltransferase
MRARMRLDALLVHKGLVESREKARALILAGQVELAGGGAPKAGTMVDVETAVRVIGPDHPWVSRGGVKLAHALELFGLGACTCGFTDVLLERGAPRVIALDVGHGQLHWKLRQDPRVTVIEGANARRLTRADLPDIGAGVGIVVVDVSFISLSLIFPVLPPLLAPGGCVIALVKPQFEAGRKDVGRKGVVSNPDVHARVIAAVTAFGAEVGLVRRGLTESPITGAQGNKEFLMLLEAQS